ncbi:OsmC family protein [Peribacillus glennii]|uniref:OsmC family peroxiredoxin n=1 Tax=Peribacillus glennii TaxID=2303991 RepID=A0A372L8H6_9BACI|nr:OsmC family protein [Peribacillus glennii]RFU61653.1 OsmC family peroxiredoxin [Peribacillus glennii]
MKTMINWTGDMAFSGTTPSGHEIKMDAAPEVGGQNSGARPTELILHSLAGCIGIDIVMILKKMRYEIQAFNMEIEGTRAEDHPKRFTDFHIHFSLEGDLPEDKVVRAIELSKDKYCSVSHSLNANIVASYSINGVKVSKNI